MTTAVTAPIAVRTTDAVRTRAPWSTRAFVEHTMGMAISLHVRALSIDLERRSDEFAAAAEGAFAVLCRADAVFSTYRADSDLMQVRRGELAEADADPWLAEIRAVADEATSVTGGLFTADLVGPDGTRGFDPTGVVKGWAIERAADVLRAVPGIVFCLNAGGDMVTASGPCADARIARTWRVGIADPRDARRITTTLDLTDGALATSGTGQRGAHILDPRSGRPAESPFSSVTVVGPDLTWADVWATAAFVDPDALAFSRMAASYRMAAFTH